MDKIEKGKWYVFEKDYISPEGQRFQEGYVSLCIADNILTTKWGKKASVSSFVVHEWSQKDLSEGLAIVVETKTEEKIVGYYQQSAKDDTEITFMSLVTPEGEYKTNETINIENATIRPATIEEIALIDKAMEDNLKQFQLDTTSETNALARLFNHKTESINNNTGWFVCTKDFTSDEYSFTKDVTYENKSNEEGVIALIDNNNEEVDVTNVLNIYFKPWTVKDVKFGDILAEDFPDNSQFIMVVDKLKEEPWAYRLMSICYLTRNGEFIGTGNAHSFQNIHPATPEQKKLINEEMLKHNFFVPSESPDYDSIVKLPEFKVFATKVHDGFQYVETLNYTQKDEFAYNEALRYWVFLRDYFKNNKV